MSRTSQEAFDEICLHLVTQGQQALSTDSEGGNACRYRTTEGLRCAVGALIPEEHYTPIMERKSLSSLLRGSEFWRNPDSHKEHRKLDQIRDDLELTGVSVDEAFNFYRKLQLIHDEYTLCELSKEDLLLEWKVSLTNFAKDNELTVPTCLKLAA